MTLAVQLVVLAIVAATSLRFALAAWSGWQHGRARPRAAAPMVDRHDGLPLAVTVEHALAGAGGAPPALLVGERAILAEVRVEPPRRGRQRAALVGLAGACALVVAAHRAMHPMSLSGRLRMERVHDLRADGARPVLQVLVRPGQRVEAGQPLLVRTDREAERRLAGLEATWRAASAALARERAVGPADALLVAPEVRDQQRRCDECAGRAATLALSRADAEVAVEAAQVALSDAEARAQREEAEARDRLLRIEGEERATTDEVARMRALLQSGSVTVLALRQLEERARALELGRAAAASALDALVARHAAFGDDLERQRAVATGRVARIDELLRAEQTEARRLADERRALDAAVARRWTEHLDALSTEVEARAFELEATRRRTAQVELAPFAGRIVTVEPSAGGAADGALVLRLADVSSMVAVARLGPEDTTRYLALEGGRSAVVCWNGLELSSRDGPLSLVSAADGSELTVRLPDDARLAPLLGEEPATVHVTRGLLDLLAWR